MGFLARVSFMAFARRSSWALVFRQSLQLQPSQYSSAAKHSQYNLRHLDFLQLQGLRRLGVFSLPDGGDRAFPGVVVVNGRHTREPAGGGCGREGGYREADNGAFRPEGGYTGVCGGRPWLDGADDDDDADADDDGGGSGLEDPCAGVGARPADDGIRLADEGVRPGATFIGVVMSGR